MTRLSGYVFDTYDDEDGQVLRTIIENPGQLPPFVKTAARLTEAQISELPDDQFALIMLADTTSGPLKLKKYATVDKGNTTLSVLYLLKQASFMPSEMVQATARNLVGALDRHGLQVPEELLKLANKKNTMSLGVSGKSQKPYVNGKVQQLQYPEILEEPKESHENPQLGRHDAAWSDVNQRTNAEGTPGNNFLELPAFPQKEKIKAASATDIDRWDTSRKSQTWDHSQLFNQSPQLKQQSWKESPYFDISGWDPSMPGVPDPTPPERTLLDGSYPIDGYDQVKTASVYFNDNWKALGFRDRHTYCVKLAHRMNELGMAIPDNIARYGATTYAADVESYVEARRSYVHEEAHPALDMLLEKRAQISPGVFAEALAEFDRLNDLNWHWDSKVADPWFSTFGPSHEKIAEENWRWDGAGTRICEEDLKDLAKNSYERLVNSFGADFAKEFAKSPKTVFTSLPDPNKLILARFASDRHSGTME